jgi:adenylosuccinate lyase
MENLSLPGNPRYQPKELIPIFGYDNLYKPYIEVEIATLKTLGEIGIIPASDMEILTSDVEHAWLGISTTEVDIVERTVTNHDIRALVHVMQEKVDQSLGRWLHIPLTSYDVIDTARMLQFKRAHQELREKTDEVIAILLEKVRTYAAIPQIGRTHGQYALPIKAGFWIATDLSRIVTAIEAANAAEEKLVGKISGAVGAKNAQVGLGITDACGNQEFEALVLKKLGLKAARISTQILPPEPLAQYLHAVLQLSAALAQFGRDGRHLMRSEIAEVREPFGAGQVGSSTMAHKRNPLNFENLEGMYIRNQAEYFKVTATMISEHQRDLVGSSVARDFPIIMVNTM